MSIYFIITREREKERRYEAQQFSISWRVRLVAAIIIIILIGLDNFIVGSLFIAHCLILLFVCLHFPLMLSVLHWTLTFYTHTSFHINKWRGPRVIHNPTWLLASRYMLIEQIISQNPQMVELIWQEPLYFCQLRTRSPTTLTVCSHSFKLVELTLEMR